MFEIAVASLIGLVLVVGPLLWRVSRDRRESRALSIREKQSDADALVAQTLNNLAQAKKRLGKVAEAEKLLRRTSALGHLRERAVRAIGSPERAARAASTGLWVAPRGLAAGS